MKPFSGSRPGSLVLGSGRDSAIRRSRPNGDGIDTPRGGHDGPGVCLGDGQTEAI